MRLFLTIVLLSFSPVLFAFKMQGMEVMHALNQFLINPNITYILMLIAFYGIFFELANPGMIAPGVIGILAFLLVLYAFQLMPINYLGLSCFLLGIFLMTVEVYFRNHGLLAVVGLIIFIIGSLLLFDTRDPNFRVTWVVIAAMSIVNGLFLYMLFSLAVNSHKRAIITGKEGLIGAKGTVLGVMNRTITVRVLGEIWQADSRTPLEPGQTVTVVGLKGLRLYIEPVHHQHQHEDS